MTGDTIFNVLRMGQVEVNESDHRPLDEIRLISVEVLWNPFDDIVPRFLSLRILLWDAVETVSDICFSGQL